MKEKKFYEVEIAAKSNKILSNLLESQVKIAKEIEKLNEKINELKKKDKDLVKDTKFLKSKYDAFQAATATDWDKKKNDLEDAIKKVKSPTITERLKVDEWMEEIDDTITNLTAKSKDFAGDAKKEFDKQISELNKRKEDVVGKIRKLKEEHGDEWQNNIQSGFKNVTESIKNTFEKASALMRKKK